MLRRMSSPPCVASSTVQLVAKCRVSPSLYSRWLRPEPSSWGLEVIAIRLVGDRKWSPRITGNLIAIKCWSRQALSWGQCQGHNKVRYFSSYCERHPYWGVSCQSIVLVFLSWNVDTSLKSSCFIVWIFIYQYCVLIMLETCICTANSWRFPNRTIYNAVSSHTDSLCVSSEGNNWRFCKDQFSQFYECPADVKIAYKQPVLKYIQSQFCYLCVF